ncbi:MAG: hypothetical protein IPP40_10810 [bacterium]|nr:hypothetical protein [bacterium]
MAIVHVVLLLGLLGCKDDDDSPHNSNTHWHAEFVVANATAPVAAPSSDLFLFTREGEGLFVWQNGTETRVTPVGTSVRPDYSWSISGEIAFAYSVPGEPSESSGVFFVETNGVVTQVWDRGSSPSLNYTANYLLCAGPVESEHESGIWKIHLPSLERDRLSTTGITPSLGNNGQVFTYLVPQSTSNGSVLTSKRMSDLEPLRMISHVARFQCASVSENLLIEIIANLDGLPIPPAIYQTSVSVSAPLELIAQPATNMLLLEDGGILFNRMIGDSLGSLIMRDGDSESIVSDSLYSASGFSRDNIFVAGVSGITWLSWY